MRTKTKPKECNQPIRDPIRRRKRLTEAGEDVLEAGLGEVAEEGERRLAHLGHGVLHALEQQLHDVGRLDQLFDLRAQALRQARQQVQRHDHEVLVGRLELLRMLHAASSSSSSSSSSTISHNNHSIAIRQQQQQRTNFHGQNYKQQDHF